MIAEPYREGDGEICFAIIEKPENPRAYCETLGELRGENKDLHDQLAPTVNSICWTSRG
jgi:hypothetical protein